MNVKYLLSWQQSRRKKKIKSRIGRKNGNFYQPLTNLEESLNLCLIHKYQCYINLLSTNSNIY